MKGSFEIFVKKKSESVFRVNLENVLFILFSVALKRSGDALQSCYGVTENISTCFLDERKALKVPIQAGSQLSDHQWAEPETHFQKSPKTKAAAASENTKSSGFLCDPLEWGPGWWFP